MVRRQGLVWRLRLDQVDESQESKDALFMEA